MTGPKPLPGVLPGVVSVPGVAVPQKIAAGAASAASDSFVVAPAANKALVPAPVSHPLLAPPNNIITIGKPRPPEDRYPIHIDPYPAEVVNLSEGQIVDWGIKYLKALDVHATTTGDRACVFVLDTGAAYDHPDLQANLLPQYSKNFTDSESPADNHGHSTHCAGIACANNNEFGVIGVAPGAKLVPVKVLNDQGSGTYEGIAAAIRYVADLEDFPYKKVISMSLGGSRGTPDLQAAIRYAIGKGVFIVVAAGNSGYRGKDTVGFPGAYPEVITVASLGPSETPSSFSSGGPAVDVIAPGENVYSTHTGKGYVKMSGTSMATPHVAGLMALILSHYPNIQNQAELEKLLTDKAKDLGKPGRDPQNGAGAPIAVLYIGGTEVARV